MSRPKPTELALPIAGESEVVIAAQTLSGAQNRGEVGTHFLRPVITARTGSLTYAPLSVHLQEYDEALQVMGDFSEYFSFAKPSWCLIPTLNMHPTLKVIYSYAHGTVLPPNHILGARVPVVTGTQIRESVDITNLGRLIGSYNASKQSRHIGDFSIRQFIKRSDTPDEQGMYCYVDIEPRLK